jgi:hypothetical protein
MNARTIRDRIKAHIRTNRAAYIMAAIAISAIALQQRNRIQFDKFLVSKGIDLDEYYIPEYYYEKQLKALQ